MAKSDIPLAQQQQQSYLTPPMPMLSKIDFASLNPYHEIVLNDIDFTEAESLLTDDRKKYLRTGIRSRCSQLSGKEYLQQDGEAGGKYSGLYHISVYLLQTHAPEHARVLSSTRLVLLSSCTGCQVTLEGEAGGLAG